MREIRERCTGVYRDAAVILALVYELNLKASLTPRRQSQNTPKESNIPPDSELLPAEEGPEATRQRSAGRVARSSQPPRPEPG